MEKLILTLIFATLSLNALAKDSYAILMSYDIKVGTLTEVKIAIGDEKGNTYSPFVCTFNKASFIWNYPNVELKADGISEMQVSNWLYRAPSFYTFVIMGLLETEGFALSMSGSLNREVDLPNMSEVKRGGEEVKGFICK